MTIAAGTQFGAPLPKQSFYELVIRDGKELDQAIIHDADEESVRRLLAVSIAGLLLFGLGVGLAMQFGNHDVGRWLGPMPAIAFPLALTTSFVGALAICLPSFWFYTQLAGLDASFRLVTLQALRVQARTSTLLLGALPFYAAVALGPVTGVLDEKTVILIGLALPFFMGLFGVVALYRSFRRLANELPVSHRRRPFFVVGVVVAWSVVYTAVCPIALAWAGAIFGDILR